MLRGGKIGLWPMKIKMNACGPLNPLMEVLPLMAMSVLRRVYGISLPLVLMAIFSGLLRAIGLSGGWPSMISLTSALAFVS